MFVIVYCMYLNIIIYLELLLLEGKVLYFKGKRSRGSKMLLFTNCQVTPQSQ